MDNIEFFNSPTGEVCYRHDNEPVEILTEKSTDIIDSVLDSIRESYPEAYQALADLYQRRKANLPYYKYSIVHRFVRCNFGEFDLNRADIDCSGRFSIEEVHCPIRGECPHEGTICKPKPGGISEREKDICSLIAEGFTYPEIGEKLCISRLTVKRHADNIRQKMGLKNRSEIVNFWINR